MKVHEEEIVKRLTAMASAGLILLAVWAPAAAAGGWAAISFDEVPGDLEAGTTHTLGFTVLAHGVRPVDAGDEVEVRFVGRPGTETFAAKASGGTGHYTVDVSLPEAGEWRWEVDTNFYPPQPLGTIDVAAAPGVLAAAFADGPLLPVLRTALPLTTLVTLGLALMLFRRSETVTGAPADAG